MRLVTDITGRSATTALVAALCTMCPACVPVPSDRGGSIPPPTINGDGGPPALVGNLDNDAGTGIDTVMVFDVRVEATSLDIGGITIDALLTVAADNAVDASQAPFTEVTLQDTVNDPNDQVGVVGGIFLEAGPASTGGFFSLHQDDEGIVVAEFSGTGRGTNPNRFILPEGGITFVPGVIGITYQVEPGSRFSFIISGDGVSGTLALTGTPITGPGTIDVYNGTFTGTRR